MGQDWILINLDKRERSGRLGKLGEFWGPGIGCNLLYRLLVPFEPVPSRITSAGANPDTAAEASGGQSTTPNPFIPDDEHSIMFYVQIRGRRDRGRPAGPPIPLSIGSWAGDRIVCVGEYAHTSCLPSNLFTPAEMAELTALQSEEDMNLYEYACEKFPSVSGFSSRVLQSEADIAYPKDKTWVLRNLTKRVYVDLEKFRAKNIGDVDQIILTMGLCWSDHPDSTLDYDITHGSWAGDQFDVNVIENVQGEGEV